jgi:hypothetical protein
MAKSTLLGKSPQGWAHVQTTGQVWLEQVPVQGAPWGQMCNLRKRGWQQRGTEKTWQSPLWDLQALQGRPSGWTEMDTGNEPSVGVWLHMHCQAVRDAPGLLCQPLGDLRRKTQIKFKFKAKLDSKSEFKDS